MASEIPGGSPESAINPTHSAIEKVKNIGAKITELAYGQPSAKLQSQVNRGVRGLFPDHGQFAMEPFPTLRAAVITPEKDENPKENSFGVFLLAGAEGTAAGGIPTAAELYLKGKGLPGEMNLAVSVSSVISLDTLKSLKDHFPATSTERAAHLAAFIAEVLMNKPTKEIYLMGTSLGGLDLMKIVPILEDLIKENQIDTKLGGIILNQSGGSYNQGLPEFALKRVAKHKSSVDEIRELYPSAQDIGNAQIDYVKASEKYGPGGSLREKRVWEEMKAKAGNPQHLSIQEKQALSRIDVEIYSNLGGNPKEVESLLKRRNALLKPVIDRIAAGAEIRQGFVNPLNYGKLFKHAVLPQESLVNMATEENRGLVDVPVAVAMGEEAYFKDQEFQAAMTGEYLAQAEKLKVAKPTATTGQIHEEAKKFFPKAPKVLFANIANWGHNSSLTNPEKFADIMIDIIRRMKQPSSQASQLVTNLKY